MLYYEMFKNHPGNAPALIQNNRTTTYAQFRQWVDKWAVYLQSVGLKKGERVGLFSKNCSEFLAAYFAVIRAGGIVVPFNFQLAMPEVAYIVKDAGLRFLIARQPLPLAESLEAIQYDGTLCQITFEEMDDCVNWDYVDPGLEETDTCTIIFTSGTTGKPKGAMLNHKNLIQNTRDIHEVLETYEGDRVLCVLPMFHCFAWTTSVSAPLYLGGCIVIEENYTLDQTVELIDTHKVQEFFGVPTMIQMFLTLPNADRLRSVRFFVSGGAPLPRKLADDFQEKFGKPVQEGYGLSEASPVVSVNPPQKIKVGSIGRPLPSVETQIRDKEEHIVPPGTIGELCVKGLNVMSGYLNRPLDTAEALRGGWLHTGDLAYEDEEGYIFIVDRLKDMIITAGENVYPREIEEVLYHHPAIQEVAVIGVPDQLRGQAIAAYVVLKEGRTATQPELRKFIRGKVANYKLPKYFGFLDQLPKNKTGKVLKTDLRRWGMERFNAADAAGSAHRRQKNGRHPKAARKP